ncbi:MAG: cytochrome c oxidase accessory protein CcoG [Flavobacteriales bacterium]|nr:cytochrome c oxidase accessory protein CcoG [Flavobacteriales bacterium]
METKDEEGSFRDHLSTLDESGNRKWIYPKKPSGRYYNYRKWLSYFLLAVLFGAPFIKIGGEPLLMVNVLQRKFVIFGQVFWPQDFYIFGLAMIVSVLFIVLFTVAFGRIFCGWFCPQTIFMEMLFRRIEYWVEGDWKHQQRLDAMPWNAEKIRKKGLKHFLFLFVSFLISNTFLAYIIGSDELISIITDPPSQHIVGLVLIIVFTLVFYGVFARMREQVCTNICPYGRLQGVMLDRNSMIVAYDHKRGESTAGRSKWRKNEDRAAEGKGDCIDCGQCVDVCPTGIDIRNGTQLECINCTACMDACDTVMEKVGFEKELIGYKSEETIATGKPFQFTLRLKAYTVVLSILLVVMVGLIVTRSDIGATVLRTPGMLYQEGENNTITNLYNFKVINKTAEDMPLDLRVENGFGTIRMVGDAVTLKAQGTTEGVMFVEVPKDQVKDRKTKVVVGIYSGDKLLKKVKTNFIGPAPGLSR